jgi:hypothetical protein
MCSRRVCNVCLLLDTRCAARIVKYSKNHVGDKFYIKKTRRFIAIYKWIFANVHQVCVSNACQFVKYQLIVSISRPYTNDTNIC